MKTRYGNKRNVTQPRKRIKQGLFLAQTYQFGYGPGWRTGRRRTGPGTGPKNKDTFAESTP